MQYQGYARLDRETANKIFKDVLAFRIYSLIELNVTHTEYEYNGIKLKPGQWIRSYSKLVEDLEYKEGRGYKKPDKSTISRAIERLIGYGVIEVEYPIRISNHATDKTTVSATDSATINATLFTLTKFQSHQGIKDNAKSINATINATDSATDNATDNANKTIINKQELINNYINDDNRQAQISAANVFKFFEENGFGLISGHKAQILNYWIDTLSEELVIEAMKRTVEQNITNLKYVETILKNWHKQGLTTLEAITAADLQREAQKQNKGGTTNNGNSQNVTTKRSEYDDLIPQSSIERSRMLAGKEI